MACPHIVVSRVATALCAAALAALTLAPAAGAVSSVTSAVHVVSTDADVPDVAVNASGAAIVVYTETEPGGVAQAWVRRLAPDGTLGAAVRVSPDGEHAVRPQVVLAADGRAFVAWRAGVSPPQAARGRWVGADGSLGTLLTLAAGQNMGTPTDRDVVDLDAVLGDDGRVTVSYRNEDQDASDAVEIGLRRVTPAGELQPAAGPLANVTANSGVVDPVSAPLPGGGTVFAFRASGIGAVIVSAAEVAGPLLSLSSPGLVAGPSLAVDASGRTTVAWRRSVDPQFGVAARRFTAAGVLEPAIDVQPLADSFIRIRTPVLAAPGGDVLVGWASQPVNDARLAIRPRSAAGGLGTTVPFSDPAQDVRAYALARDGLGNAYAAWSTQAPDPDAIVLQPLAFAGTPAGPRQTLDTTPNATVADLALGESGIGAGLVERLGAQETVVLRQLIPPPGGCSPASASTTAPASVSIALTCEGVQTRPEVISGPARGTLGAVGGDGRITYTPNAGFAGTDTFTIRAVNAAGVTGGTAAVTVRVAARDTTAPVVSSVSVSNRRFRAGRRGAQAAATRRAPAGTAFRFTLSEAALVRIAIDHVRSGRRSGRRCVAPTRRTAKARRCTRYVASGAVTRDLTAGRRSVAFSGRRRGTALAIGPHRATIRATDAAGNVSKPRSVRFTIARR